MQARERKLNLYSIYKFKLRFHGNTTFFKFKKSKTDQSTAVF